MSEKVLENNYTKISIRKPLHNIVKEICGKTGVKMYHFEDKAIIEYIKKNYPQFANGTITKISEEYDIE